MSSSMDPLKKNGPRKPSSISALEFAGTCNSSPELARPIYGLPPPRCVYKYLEKQFASSLVHRGEILLRPLKSFRNKGLGFGRLDGQDGQVGYYCHQGTFDMHGGTDPRRLLLRAFGVDIANTSRCTISNARGMIEPPEHYAWCISERCTTKAARLLSPRYDACVEILDIVEFAKALAQGLQRHIPVGSVHVDRVLYTPQYCHLAVWNHYIYPAFIKSFMTADKSIIFAEQSEVRIIIESLNVDELLKVRIPEIIPYMRLMDRIPEHGSHESSDVTFRFWNADAPQVISLIGTDRIHQMVATGADRFLVATKYDIEDNTGFPFDSPTHAIEYSGCYSEKFAPIHTNGDGETIVMWPHGVETIRHSKIWRPCIQYVQRPVPPILDRNQQ